MPPHLPLLFADGMPTSHLSPSCSTSCCLQAILNFDLSHYQDILDNPDAYEPVEATGSAPATSIAAPTPGNSSGANRGSARAQAGLGPAAPAAAALPGAPFMVSPSAAAAAAAAAAASAMAGGTTQGSALFLPLMQPMQLGALGVQQQFGMSFSLQPPMAQFQHGSNPAAAAAIAAAAAAAQAAGPPRLAAIRTRGGAAAAAAAVPRTASLGDFGRFAAGGDSGGTGGSTPGSSGSGDGSGPAGSGLDLSDFLLSPLAASLLSPLGLSGSPSGEPKLLCGAAGRQAFRLCRWTAKRS